jgi:hypothetical protein
MYATDAPLKGALIVIHPPPFTDAPTTVWPLAGLNHSTVRAPATPERFTLTLPPFG